MSQLKDYTRLSNEIVEALAKTNLTSYEWRVLMVVFRKTYGFNKKEDWIAQSQITLMTGIHKAHVSRALRFLGLRNMVTKRGNKIGFNRYSNTWIELPNGVTNHATIKKTEIRLPNGAPKLPNGAPKLPNGADTKDNNTKDTIQKTYSPIGESAKMKEIQPHLEPFAMYCLLFGIKNRTPQEWSLLIRRNTKLSKQLADIPQDRLAAAMVLAEDHWTRKGKDYPMRLETVNKHLEDAAITELTPELRERAGYLVSTFRSVKHSIFCV